jgi:hypothetical protein
MGSHVTTRICGHTHTHTLCVFDSYLDTTEQTYILKIFKIKITNNWDTITKFPLNSTGSHIHIYYNAEDGWMRCDMED